MRGTRKWTDEGDQKMDMCCRPDYWNMMDLLHVFDSLGGAGQRIIVAGVGGLRG